MRLLFVVLSLILWLPADAQTVVTPSSPNKEVDWEAADLDPPTVSLEQSKLYAEEARRQNFQQEAMTDHEALPDIKKRDKYKVHHRDTWIDGLNGHSLGRLSKRIAHAATTAVVMPIKLSGAAIQTALEER